MRALRPVALRGFVGLCLLFALVLPRRVHVRPEPALEPARPGASATTASARGPADPLVAWQMNWKGENFYTGNRVAVFADSNNKEFTGWIDKNKGKTAFVLLEHGRLVGSSPCSARATSRSLTTERDNNKFVLVRVAL